MISLSTNRSSLRRPRLGVIRKKRHGVVVTHRVEHSKKLRVVSSTGSQKRHPVAQFLETTRKFGPEAHRLFPRIRVTPFPHIENVLQIPLAVFFGGFTLVTKMIAFLLVVGPRIGQGYYQQVFSLMKRHGFINYFRYFRPILKTLEVYYQMKDRPTDEMSRLLPTHEAYVDHYAEKAVGALQDLYDHGVSRAEHRHILRHLNAALNPRRGMHYDLQFFYYKVREANRSVLYVFPNSGETYDRETVVRIPLPRFSLGFDQEIIARDALA